MKRRVSMMFTGIRRCALLAGLLMTVAAMFLTSCDHRDILTERPAKRLQVTVEFDWSGDPGASPKGMTVYFFREGGSSPVAYEFRGRDGGTVTLAPGVYSAICHNSDSDRHGFVGQEIYEEFGLRLNDHRDSGNLHSAMLPRVSGERLAHSPDSIWIAAVPLFEVKGPAPSSPLPDKPLTVRFNMESVVNHYTFIIHNPINFTSSMSVTATISGMAATVHPGRGVKGDETVTHLFSMAPTADGGLQGDLLTFGHCGGGPATTRAEGESQHILVVNATLRDGQQWSSTHDVTDRIHNSEVADCVVRLDSVAFPTSVGGGEGFSPNVAGWDIGKQEPIGM